MSNAPVTIFTSGKILNDGYTAGGYYSLSIGMFMDVEYRKVGVCEWTYSDSLETEGDPVPMFDTQCGKDQQFTGYEITEDTYCTCGNKIKLLESE